MNLPLSLTSPQSLSVPWRRVALVVNLAALALLCSELARITWQVFAPNEAAVPGVASTTIADDSSKTNVNAASLFGRSAQTEKPAVVASASGFSLSGVVAAGRSSLALISVDGAAAEPFFIGQEIAKGRHLHAAAEDHVLIRYGAVIERLDLSGRDSGGGDSTAAPAAATAATAPTAGVDQIAPNRFALSRGMAEAQLRSPEFLRQAMMVPQADGGFLVREITPGSLYEKLGLKAGDVIRSVNGSPVNNLDDAMQLYKKLGTVGQVLIEINRGGKAETLEYTIR